MKIALFFTILLVFSINANAKEYSFNDLYKIAVKKDPRLSDFQYSYRVLKAQLSKVEAAFYPKLSYTLGIVPMGRVNTDTPSGSMDDMDFSEWGLGLDSKISFIQPIYTFGKWSTGMKMAKKRAELEIKKVEKLKQKIKFDLTKAYQALVMIHELERITSYGEKQLKKALKQLKKLDEEDSDDYSDNDYFKLKIYEQKLIDSENELKALKEQIRFALINMLGIDKNFTIKDKKLKPSSFTENWNFKTMFEYKMLMNIIELSKLNLDLQTNYFTPDIFFWASWSIKTSTVADKHSGYDPYHSNVPAAGLGIRWNLDFMVLKANYKIAKIQLLQNQNRVDILKKLSQVKDFKMSSETKLLQKRIAVKRKISKKSKQWFTGNAMDYYTGIGSSKKLLESLAAYQKSKVDLIRAIYNYNIKLSSLKLFRGEN